MALGVLFWCEVRDSLYLSERFQAICASADIPWRPTSFPSWVRQCFFASVFLMVALQIASPLVRSRHDAILLTADVLVVPLLLGFALLDRNLYRNFERMKLALIEAGALLRDKPVSSPPKAAKYILLLVPKRHRDHLVGDLEEEYATIVLPEYGLAKARFWYWWQVLSSIAPLFFSEVRRLAAWVFLLRRIL